MAYKVGVIMAKKRKKEKKTLEQLCKKEKEEYEEYVENQITKILGVISNIALGDLNVQAEREKNDVLGALADGINIMIGEIRKRETQMQERINYSLKRTKELIEIIQKAAAGDLTASAPISDRKDEFDALAAGLNMMLEEMHERDIELKAKIKELDKARLILYSLSEDIQEEKESVERKVRERTAELEQERAKLAAVTENMTIGAILLDDKGKAIFANKAAKNILGIRDDKDDILEIFFIKFAKADVKKHFLECIQGKPHKIPEVEVAPGIFEISFLCIPDKKNHKKEFFGHLIWIKDITPQKILERAKSEFVSIASHQLRTPLTSIKLFLEMLADEEVGKLNSLQKDYIENIQKSSERMIKLINNLLNVSRLEAGTLKIEPRLMQLEDFVATLIEEAKPLDKTGKCNVVFIKPKRKLPKIPIDPSLLRQVIYNLLANAIQYSLPGRCNIAVKIKKEGEDYIISVKDTGIGIPRKAQPRIFEKFFRADNAVRLFADGSGLGLYVIKMIVNSWGGKMTFESEENKGTTFYFTIPTKGMKKKKGEKGLRHWWS